MDEKDEDNTKDESINSSNRRTTLNGAWKLDKTRGEPSLRGFLEAMCVSQLAIAAHEKGEQEHETIHMIFLSDTQYKIKKLSRVNDLEEEYQLNTESIKIYPPGDRKRVTLATSNGLHHISIHTKMPTMNGPAEVTDIKTLVTKDDSEFPSGAKDTDVFLVQDLTIRNIAMERSNTSRRYYIPFEDDNKDFDLTFSTPNDAGTVSNDAMDEAEDED